MGVDSYTTLKAHVLTRALEATDGTSEFDSLADDAIIAAWRDLTVRWPWLDFRKDPPGAGVVAADITTLTITVATAGEGVSGTLSSVPSVSVVGYKCRPASKNWIARITAQAGAVVTFDAVPETLAAGRSVTLFKDEYELASDLGVFEDGIWWQDGHFVALVEEEWLRRQFPDPPSGARVPSYFARLGRRKIRFSEYPIDVQRFEYPYTYEPSDPSGSGTLVIAAHLRHALAQLSLSLLYEMKLDRREGDAKARAEEMINGAIAYERRRRTGYGQFTSTTVPRYGA